MGIIRTICLWILVAQLCISFTFSLDYSKFGEDQLVDPASGEIDENLAEMLSISCRQELNDINEAFEDLNSHLPREALHPELQQVLSDCIRKNNNLFQVSGEDSGFKTWYSRYFESLFHWHEVPRRALATQSIAVAPAPNVGPSPAPAPAPTSESPRLSPESLPSSPLPLPVPSNQAAPPINDLSDSISPANRDPTHGGTDNSRIIIIACVVTAVVTSVFVALFFFLYCRRGSAAKQNDERPLLSSSLNELSCGSSHAYAFGTNDSSIHEKASTNGNVHTESNAHQISFDGKSSFGAVAAATKASAAFPDKPSNNNPLLPLPPGRVGASRPGLPPLKSPPDRADPLPPEPPAPIRASPTPPPPVPPPMKPASVTMGPRPPPPPMPPGGKPGPCPPPPPNAAYTPPRPPPPMPFGSKMPPRPPSGPQRTPNAIFGEGSGSADDANAPKAKLKPFFWDKVAANPDQSMVWNQIKSGSFQFNEEMIETLFGSVDKNKNDRKKETSTQESVPQYIQLIDPKKAQNLAILLRALNVTTEEVCDALCEGNKLPVELLQTLLKMAPTADEELKFKMFNGEISQLGPAERFLKVLVDIPFAFKRMEALLFMCSLYEEVTFTKDSFQTLEIACKELRSSRLFLKLLEAVLKTGNRMNDGTFRGGAQAFKLDTLLKLSDVKGVDGKTTLLHFVVQEIIRTEGMRAARAARENKSDIGIKSDDPLQDVSPDTEEHYHSLGLQVVSCLSSELENVKKAAATDADTLTGTVAKLGHGLVKACDFLNLEMKNTEEESGFHQTLRSFVQKAEVDVMSLLKEEKRIMTLVKSTGDYFHGNAHKDEGLRLFVIIRDFLIILDKVCKEIKIPPRKGVKEHKKNVSNASSSSSESRLASTSPDPQQKLFSAIAERRMDDFSSSSDDES